jgi:ABC-type multidrug transport system fused ATPase/permease subunit
MSAIDISAPAPATSWSLRRVFAVYHGRILFTYGLFNLENLLRLAQPLVLGWAINDLLSGEFFGLGMLVLQHIAYMSIGTWRRAYDTRAFTSIYQDLATEVVMKQRAAGVETSRVAARSNLSRAFVDFFEHNVPTLVQALYSVVGAVIALGVFDPMLALFCFVLVGPGWLLNRIYGKKIFALNGRLHDELEREVEVIEGTQPAQVRGHYGAVAHWLVKLSDWEAINFGVMELFILVLMAATLVRTCSLGFLAGDILAIFQYLLMFLMGVDSVPMLVQQLSRLRDVGQRIGDSERSPH